VATGRGAEAIEQFRRTQAAAVDFLDKRTPRERQMLALMAIAIGIWLLYWLVQGLIVGPMAQAKRTIAAREVALRQMRILQADYRRVQGQVSLLETQIRSGQQGNVLSMLEEMANEVQIKDKITSMDPRSIPPNDLYRESVIEVRLQSVNLKELTDYLFKIENSGSFLKIKRLRIKSRTDDPGHLDVTFRVSSFEPITPGSPGAGGAPQPAPQQAAR